MYLDSFFVFFFKICIIELGYVRWTWTCGRRANADRPKVGRKVRAFRLSQAVSHLFDDLNAEGRYLSDENFLVALLNRERCPLGAVGTSTLLDGFASRGN